MGATIVASVTNVRLWFSISGGEPVLFKGDADRDLPGAVPDVPR